MATWRWITFVLGCVLGMSFVVWEWLAYARYCQSPPWMVFPLVFGVFWALMGTSMTLSRKVNRARTRALPGV